MTYDPSNYIADAHRTAPEQSHLVVFDEERHAIYGIVGEIGEVARLNIDNKLNLVTARDELGDVCWYLALLLHHHNYEMHELIKPDKVSAICSAYKEYGVVQTSITSLVIHASEIMERIKKRDAYGKMFSWADIEPNAVKILYHVVILAAKNGLTLNEILEANIAKLRARFPEKFEASLAINKDPEAELEAQRQV